MCGTGRLTKLHRCKIERWHGELLGSTPQVSQNPLTAVQELAVFVHSIVVNDHGQLSKLCQEVLRPNRRFPMVFHANFAPTHATVWYGVPAETFLDMLHGHFASHCQVPCDWP